jgi:hypothetical protein
MTAVAVIAGSFFRLLPFVLNKPSVVNSPASDSVSGTITDRKSLAIRFTDRCVWKARASGVRRIRITGSNIARTTPSKPNGIASNSTSGTESGGWCVLQTTTWLST